MHKKYFKVTFHCQLVRARRCCRQPRPEPGLCDNPDLVLAGYPRPAQSSGLPAPLRTPATIQYRHSDDVIYTEYKLDVYLFCD